jgi:molybdate/tungstate transport system substrate-binding protein
MIFDGLRSPDVFISADAAVNDKVLMKPEKNLTDWYVTFASSAMVLGYNPNSKLKGLFEQVQAGKLPWYEALKTPGLKLGRTDPNPDPKGYRTREGSCSCLCTGPTVWLAPCSRSMASSW